MSQFSFLETEFTDEFEASSRAEKYALEDPGTSVIHARRALESAVKWAFKNDPGLRQPYEDQLNAYLHEESFRGLANGLVFSTARKIQKAGNKAVHESKPPSKVEAVEIVSALFNFMRWFADSYSRGVKPDRGIRFDPHALMAGSQSSAKSLAERKALEAELAQKREETDLARQRVAELAKSKEELAAELAALRAEVAASRKAAEASPILEEDWSEAETRVWKIDVLLKEAGWALTEKRDREYEVSGMPSGSGVGFVDYVLWGDDGKPLALVEAKRSTVSIETGRQQGKLYADCLEAEFGQRPVIFLSNGYEHEIWDDVTSAPRSIQGFHSKDELELMIQRRTSVLSLAGLDVNPDIAGRYYQERAIRAIAEHFETGKQRKALVVMATGAGKTRTTIALVDLLMRANMVKRVLFLADRTALVNQAMRAFNEHLPDSSPVNLVTEKDENGRVYGSTYQTMIGMLSETFDRKTGEITPARFGVGHFDLVVIDEAHRSVYKKYKSIFDYFDSLLVGLTATPKEDVSKNTYELFDLESGVPTDVYSLEDAIADGFLVPPNAISIPLKFVREGIRYDELSEDDKEEWDEIDWDDEDEDPPDEVGAGAVNKWLFNQDTVDKVLKQLMTDGLHVEGGDRLGKTIIFAKNQKHAEFIYKRFVANYPALDNGNFARIITNKTKYAQSLIDDFGIADKAPHIAISVDMLDTGIDVPDCVNLVFFKMVRSQTKFWQMVGRGTRLSPDLFGPGEDKQYFRIFDYLQNLEYFTADIPSGEAADAPSISERLFLQRVEILGSLDRIGEYDGERSELAEMLRSEVDSMNEKNFIVRPHLQAVERFRETAGWSSESLSDPRGLAAIASLPRDMEAEPEEAKRFDILVLSAQLGVLDGFPFAKAQEAIRKLARKLEEKTDIPAVSAHMELIQDVMRDEWWEGVTYPMLESARKKLRLIVHLIDKKDRSIVYTNVTDELGESAEIDLVPGAESFAQFHKKAEHFLKENLGEAVVAKVRSGEPITEADVAELQRILVAAGVGDDASFEAASERAGSFGLFIRGIVGLDRAAAKESFTEFLDDKRYSTNQLRFVNLIIDELTSNGVLSAKRLYEPPYAGVAPEGPEDLFTEAELNRMFAAIKELTENAS